MVVTAPNMATLDDLGGDENSVLALALAITDDAAIAAGIDAAIARFGRIALLANVAGYGYMSSAEEGEDRRIRAMFDTNVFGLFTLTRAILPHMRACKNVLIFNFTSVAIRLDGGAIRE